MRQQPEFLKLWAGQTVSLLGSQVTLLALPLTAVLVLGATPTEMGLLQAAATLPFLLVGLLAGVWVDRLRRRPILILSDLGRALLLASIPLVASFGRLNIEQLYVVALLSGLCTLFFDVAYQSFLPVLVGRPSLVAANSRLEVSRATAQLAGPGLGGLLVQLVTAPLAITLDALSFVVSAVCLLAIRTPEPPPEHVGHGWWPELREGLQVVLGSPLLRSIAGCTATSNLFSSALEALLVLYATRELGLAPALLGLALSASSVGALLAALLIGPLTRRLGVGWSIIGGIMLAVPATALVPLAGGSPPLATAVLAVSQVLLGLGSVLYNVNQVSLRQAITPDRVQGRMNATMRFLVWGTMAPGSLLGGLLGDAVGLHTTLLLVTIGTAVAPLWVILSPVRRLRHQPTPT